MTESTPDSIPQEPSETAGPAAGAATGEVRWRNVGLSLGTLLGACGIVAGLLATRPEPPRSKVRVSVTGVRVVLALSREVKPVVEGLGLVRPLRTVRISAEVGGLVRSIHADLRDGLVLEAGAVAVEIDPSDLAAEHRRSAALADAARAEHARLEAQAAHLETRVALARELATLETERLVRDQDLLAKDVRTDRDVEAARLASLRARDSLLALQTSRDQVGPQIAAALARVAEAEATQALAMLRLERATLTIPFTGVVAKVAVEQHQLLSPGTVLFELWQVDQVEVPVSLTLADATLLASDLVHNAKAKPDEAEQVDVQHDGVTYTGILRRFEPVDSATQTVKAVVLVDNSAADVTPLLPNVFCRVTLRGAQHEKGLAIPVSALQERDRVYAVRDGKLAVLSPGLGKRFGRWVFVTSGLEPGEQVIVSPLEKVVEGVSLEVVEVVEATVR
jgi:RND family efflux transporter MFP subunit